MQIEHLVILGLVQGLTEFLPISSSAHLILLPALAGWQDQGIVYDVAVHTGSLGAVLLYFRSDIQDLLQGALRPVSGSDNRSDYLLWYIALATLPVCLAGLLLHDLVATVLRSPQIIAGASIFFGLVLWWADRTGAASRSQADLGWRDAVIIGLAQVLALVPGTSRSGITITAGLMLGMDRHAASRFSFLLAIPVIIAATAYESTRLVSAQVSIEWLPVLCVALVAFASALLAIHFFLKLLDRTGMLPYVIYRVLLGLVLLAMY